MGTHTERDQKARKFSCVIQNPKKCLSKKKEELKEKAVD